MGDDESLNGNADFAGFSPSPPPPASGKRKRDADDIAPSTKRAKSRKTKKPKDITDDDLDEQLGVNKAIGRMDPALLCDTVAQRIKRFEPDLSAVELDEKYIPVHAVRDTSEWSKDRTKELLPDFLKSISKEGLSKAPKGNGHPHTIVVAAAGLRAADLTRALRAFETKDAKVAKLFAKHIKLKEAVASCKSTKMNIGVGTPQRIDDLLDDGMFESLAFASSHSPNLTAIGALSSKHLQRIVVDASHIDQKKRGILDMKETLVPLVKLLTRAEFKERYGAANKPVELIFF